VDGRVVPGAGRGRGLGFATANVATELLLPGNGVYAVRAWVRPAGAATWRRHGGVCNIGVKPTVEADARPGAEAHLFGHDGADLYGASIRLAFPARLRDERRFPSLAALRAQITADAEQARALLAALPDDGPGGGAPAPNMP
jgi:riboflavin kinase/FMN adenylyltransferase